MSLLEMGFAGGVLILAVVVLRALTLNRLPKGTFLALWAVAVLRLLVPFSIPSPASIYTLAENAQIPEAVSASAVPAMFPGTPEVPAVRTAPGAASAAVPAGGAAIDVWSLAWLAGAAVCGVFFMVSYLRCRREFAAALPVEGERLKIQLADRRLRRTVRLCQSDRVDAPLTYGLLRPVILLPKGWEDTARLGYVLEHELTHIRHLDALWKLLLVLTACVHWFNPLVWCMFVLANQDLELRCDEKVVRRLGLDSRAAYALALISMEEKKSGLNPFASAFSKNAIEERIVAIMKLKKRSLAVILAAVVLVCCVGVGFATSAAEKEPDLREYLTAIPGYTEAESRQLFSLWFEGYEDMFVADYREKMRSERGEGEFMELIERFSLDEIAYQLPAGKEADALTAFNDYFFHIYEPLTADQWLVRDFDGVGANGAEYCFRLTILDADALTAGSYDRARSAAEELLRRAPDVDSVAPALENLSTPALQVELGYYITSFYGTPDIELHAQSSRETAAEWDRLLTPYAPFGLTWEFNDPDLDGNGLTMWFQGKEVRGIMDEQEGIWITEHAGNGFSDGAVELYTVYTDGVLSGLRETTPEEQAAFDEDRDQNAAKRQALLSGEEQREFPHATREDYNAFLTLRTDGYKQMSLAAFNQRLLDWANEDADGVWDRISCDVAWNNYGVELSGDEWGFAAVTCLLSGRENAAMVRSLYLDAPEEDPHFSASMPDRTAEENGIVPAWCSLYYDISYHVVDKSAATVEERDSCVVRMMNAIDSFWKDTDAETLLQMTEEDIVARFNAFALVYSTENVQINPITADDIHFEAYDERGID